MDLSATDLGELPQLPETLQHLDISFNTRLGIEHSRLPVLPQALRVLLAVQCALSDECFPGVLPPHLRELDLSVNGIRDLGCLGTLPPSLEVLRVAGNFELSAPLPKMPEGLRVLKLRSTPVSDLASAEFANCASLQDLDAVGCRIPDLGPLPLSLRTLMFKGCESLLRGLDLRCYASLQKLVVHSGPGQLMSDVVDHLPSSLKVSVVCL